MFGNVDFDVPWRAFFNDAFHLFEVCRVADGDVRHFVFAYLFAALAVVIDNEVDVAVLTQQFVHLAFDFGWCHFFRY